jgi:alpha-1,6-mannosyltransferase
VHFGLLLIFDLAHHLALTLTLLGAAFLGLLWAARRLEAIAEMTTLSARAILLAALLLRLPLLPLPPTLSDDVLRYLWDGKVAAAGFNPYALPPAAGRLSPLRDEMWRRLPHTQVPTVYPPLSVAAFSIASRLPFPLLGWKTFVTGADLLACWLLLAVARRLGVPPGRTVWYAWNPLVTLEVAGMGHVDALGVAAVVAVVLCLLSPTPRKTSAAATWAAVGALAKLVPLAAFPLWARQSGRPWRFLGAAGGLTALAMAPVVVAARGVPPGLVTYGISWEFDGPVYEPLWRALDRAGAAPALAHGLDRWKEWSQNWTSVNPLYPYLYPQLLAKLLLAGGVAAVVLASLRWRDPAASTGRLFGALLLLSATVYPWYLLWVLPWAALRRHTAWLALSALILLSYLPQFAGVPLWPWVYVGIWGPFFGLLLFGPKNPKNEEGRMANEEGQEQSGSLNSPFVIRHSELRRDPA